MKKTVFAAAIAAAAMVAGGSQAASNLITNGSFETNDFTGWTADAVSYPMYTVTSPVEDGTYAAQIAGFDYGPDTLTQVVADTAGRSYALSFWYWQDPGAPNGFVASWNGATVFMQTPDLPLGTGGAYENITTTVLGTGSDTLEFAAYNNPAFTYLDNVSVSTAAVPEPAAWASMILGVGLAGGAVRRRKAPAAV